MLLIIHRTTNKIVKNLCIYSLLPRTKVLKTNRKQVAKLAEGSPCLPIITLNISGLNSLSQKSGNHLKVYQLMRITKCISIQGNFIQPEKE